MAKGLGPLLLIGGAAAIFFLAKKKEPERAPAPSPKPIPVPEPEPEPTYLLPGTHKIYYQNTYRLVLPNEAFGWKADYDNSIHLTIRPDEDDARVWYVEPDKAVENESVNANVIFYPHQGYYEGAEVANYTFEVWG